MHFAIEKEKNRPYWCVCEQINSLQTKNEKRFFPSMPLMTILVDGEYFIYNLSLMPRKNFSAILSNHFIFSFLKKRTCFYSTRQ